MFRLSENRRGAGLVVEILMIVIGINVALWFEGWFQDLEDIETEAEYLADLRGDLMRDIRELEVAIESGVAKSARTTEILSDWDAVVHGTDEDRAEAIYTPPMYQFFTPSGFTFHSMQESGDFRLLRDAEVKKGLLSLDRRYRLIDTLQSNYLQALDDGYIPLMMQSFDIATMTVSDPTLFDNQLFRNFFVYTKQDIDGMVYVYRKALEDAEALLELLPES